MQPKERAYASPLRDEQRALTRARIVDAAAQLLADESLADLTIPRVARKAGVSVRTVYFHFPTKDVLLSATADLLDERIGSVVYPEHADQLPEFVAGLFEGFGRDEVLFRGLLASRAGQKVRSRGRGRRKKELEKALKQELAGLDELTRRQRIAAIYALHSVNTWVGMKDYFGLTAQEAGQATAWALRALIAELRRSSGDRNP